MTKQQFSNLAGYNPQPWNKWQRAVVEIIRNQFRGELAVTGVQDVDWTSWRSYYQQGRSAQSAVGHALLIDL
jgi:hypothetical protein